MSMRPGFDYASLENAEMYLFAARTSLLITAGSTWKKHARRKDITKLANRIERTRAMLVLLIQEMKEEPAPQPVEPEKNLEAGAQG